MPRILKLQKVDVPVGRNYRPLKKKSWTKRLILGLSIEKRISFQSDFIFWRFIAQETVRPTDFPEIEVISNRVD